MKWTGSCDSNLERYVTHVPLCNPLCDCGCLTGRFWPSPKVRFQDCSPRIQKAAHLHFYCSSWFLQLWLCSHWNDLYGCSHTFRQFQICPFGFCEQVRLQGYECPHVWLECSLRVDEHFVQCEVHRFCTWHLLVELHQWMAEGGIHRWVLPDNPSQECGAGTCWDQCGCFREKPRTHRRVCWVGCRSWSLEWCTAFLLSVVLCPIELAGILRMTMKHRYKVTTRLSILTDNKSNFVGHWFS